MRGRVANVIISVKFYRNRLRGFRAVRGQKWGSSIDFDSRPYNRSALYRAACDTFEPFVQVVILPLHVAYEHICSCYCILLFQGRTYNGGNQGNCLGKFLQLTCCRLTKIALYMIVTSGFVTALECIKSVFSRSSPMTPLEELTALSQTP